MTLINFIKIPSGTFLMGASTNEGHPLDKETPQKNIYVKSFEISETTITNEQFLNFVNDTGYITTAEKLGGSFVFHSFLNDEQIRNSSSSLNTPWWKYVEGASWKHPFGPDSKIDLIMDHPVVHVSFFDALNFCSWGGYRLPNEAEWEYAARAGSKHRWPWGDEFMIDNRYRANIWQGEFPYINTEEDGYLGTCPVKTFEPNNFGLYNVIGNVWEWCNNLYGIDLSCFESELDNFEFDDETKIAIRGGSFLCHPNYCNRFRLGARNGSYANSTSSNCGFRVCK